MSFFQWKADFEVGHEKIDFQHKNLVNLLNNIYEASKLDKAAAEVAVRVTLENLVEYTVFHFQTEEKIMAENHFPNMTQHLAEHTALKSRVLEFAKKFEEGNLQIIVLLEFLKEWLQVHIGKRDKELAKYLAK